jgi:hypothetical protein|tara:strand:+ start:2410 stop:3087 length:678 start_codon:yes stop_codon:yes gene_type:complete
MSGKLKLNAASGGGSISIQAPSSSSNNRVLTLPDVADSTILTSESSLNSSKLSSINLGSLQVLEKISSPCDGTTFATAQGNVTVANTTSSQSLASSETFLNGSGIGYTPPANTTTVIYRFIFSQAKAGDTNSGGIYRFKIDDVQVGDARFVSRFNVDTDLITFQWSIGIGGSAVTATGRQASWTSSKYLKLTQARINSDYDGTLHSSSNGDFRRPIIEIEAIGSI